MTINTIKRPAFIILMYVCFLVFLLITDPNKLAIGWLIVPFIWLFVSVFISVLSVMEWLGTTRIRAKKRLGFAALVAFVPTFILLLDSINQLTLKDILLIVIFGSFAGFYISKLAATGQ